MPRFIIGGALRDKADPLAVEQVPRLTHVLAFAARFQPILATASAMSGRFPRGGVHLQVGGVAVFPESGNRVSVLYRRRYSWGNDHRVRDATAARRPWDGECGWVAIRRGSTTVAAAGGGAADRCAVPGVGVVGISARSHLSIRRTGWGGKVSTAELFGDFTVSVMHNAVHLASGITAIAMSGTAVRARWYLLSVGLVYLALWVYGLLITSQVATNILPVDLADTWLLLCLGIVMTARGNTALAVAVSRWRRESGLGSRASLTARRLWLWSTNPMRVSSSFATHRNSGYVARSVFAAGGRVGQAPMHD